MTRPPVASGAARCLLSCLPQRDHLMSHTIVLCDLIPSGQVGIEVVLPVKGGSRLYFSIQSNSGTDS